MIEYRNRCSAFSRMILSIAYFPDELGKHARSRLTPSGPRTEAARFDGRAATGPVLQAEAQYTTPAGLDDTRVE